MLKFLRNWTLPIAMLVGTLAYLMFAKWGFLAPAKPFVHGFVSFITPWLIFAQLLLTFCKIDVQELLCISMVTILFAFYASALSFKRELLMFT